jgi:molecular chaperone DnaK
MRNLADPGKDERARMRLKKAAEECKIALSTKEAYEISLPFLLTAKGGKPVSVEKTVTKGEFEGWVREKVGSTRVPIMTALSDAGLSSPDLDFVLLVGGSTRIPCVRELVSKALSAIPHSLVDPDLTVARGAAIQAGILEGSLTGEQELVLTDVCPYTLGIAVLHDGVFDERPVFDPIIPRNTTIPTEITKIYYPYNDYQTKVRIEAYQGDNISLEYNERLGDVTLSGIPAAKRGKEPVAVTFAYDMNGILQVKATAISNHKEVSVEINTAGVNPMPLLDLSKWETAVGAKRQRPLIRKAEKQIAAGNDEAGELQMLVQQIKESLLLEDKEQVEILREELLECLEALG